MFKTTGIKKLKSKNKKQKPPKVQNWALVQTTGSVHTYVVHLHVLSYAHSSGVSHFLCLFVRKHKCFTWACNYTGPTSSH